MARKIINLGTPPRGQGGDTIRSAFQKTNENFEEIFDLSAEDESHGNLIDVQGGKEGEHFHLTGDELATVQGMKGASQLDVGSTANTVAAGDDSRIVNAVPKTRKVNGKGLSSDINLTPSDVGAEPAFAKETGFNKAFGTTAGTVAAGDHGHGDATTSAAGFMSAADKAKLDGVAEQATKNQNDAYLLDRENHTGTQDVGTITGLADVATSGSYDDLKDKPVIPAAADQLTQEQAEDSGSTLFGLLSGQRIRQAILGWWNASTFKTKLDGIEAGATKNATDAQLRDRATHTGVQPINTVSGLQGELDSINLLIGDIASALDAINGEVV